MPIEAEDLQSWIGSDVVDVAGAKLGKVKNIYFHGPTAQVIEVASGLGGRKRSLASLNGATVSREHIRVESENALIATDTGLDADALAQLSERDATLSSYAPEDLESLEERQARERAAAAAAARAQQLEIEAERKRDAEQAAATAAKEAAATAEAARQERVAADEAARQARADADSHSGG